jgi:hypothetical protein
MAGTSKLLIEIIADNSKAAKALKETSADVTDVGKSASGMGTAIVAGAAAGVAGLVALGVGAFNAAEESAKIGRETERVIRTTGAAAWTSAAQVGELSTAISDKTGADDEAVQSGANLLLTFTNIHNEVGKGNDIFDQATGLALDMATALGTDMSGASIQLGKALNDPIKGITALSRAGVSFTAAQKEQIKAMVEAGDTLGAQKVILAELSKEFGGAAEAAGTPLDKLRVKIGNFQEDVGAFLIPAVDAVANALGNTMGPAIEKATGFLSDHEEAIKLLASIGLVGLAAAYAPVVAGQIAMIASNVAGWAGEATAAVYVFTAGLLETAAAEGVLAAASVALEAAMLPVIAPVVLLGAGLYGLASFLTNASEAAGKFIKDVTQDVDTSSFDDLSFAAAKMDERLQSLNDQIARHTFADLAVGVADILVPFHDVTNSMTDQEQEYKTLDEAHKAYVASITASKQALFDYAMASTLAANGLDEQGNSSKAATGATADFDFQLRGTQAALEAIAKSQKIDLTTPDAVERVKALYEKTQFATESTLGLSDAQEKYSDAAATAKDKTDALKSSFDALIGIHLSAREAETQFSQNSISLLKTLTENRLAAAGATEAGTNASLANINAVNNNNRALQDNVKSALDLANAKFRETGSLDEASASLNANRENLIKVMVATGYTEEAARKYIDQLGLTPANIDTAVNLDNAAATQGLAHNQGQLADVDKGAHANVTADTAQAERNIRTITVMLDGFIAKASQGAVIGGVASFPGRAAGGPVSPGGMYIVGEKGPELFTSQQRGFITPLGTTSLRPLGGNVTINVTVPHTGLAVDSPRLQRDIVDALNRYVSRNGRARLPLNA